MKTSLKRFNNEFIELLLNLHWKQWSAFGVSSHWGRGSNYILDLEALSVSTIALGLFDKRLAHVAMEWLQVNRRWLNLFRMKRIGKLFAKHETYLHRSLLDRHVLSVYQQFLKPSEPYSAIWEDYYINADNYVQHHLDLINSFKPRGIVNAPDIYSKCLLQLFLRNVFGIDARAEMFLYFICGRSGNSNYMSKEIHFAQRTLSEILNSWESAGIIVEDEEVSSPDYALKNYNYWIKALGIDKPYSYVNWSRIYLFLDRLAIGLEDQHLQSDTYLASSYFRDLASDARYISSVTGIDLPHEKSFRGKAYFEPFAECILKMMKKLIQ